jgi:hypothetical protein
VQHELIVTRAEHYIDMENEPKNPLDGRFTAFKRYIDIVLHICYEICSVVFAMMDLSLLKNIPFLLFVMSNLLASAGLNPPLIFLPDQAIKLGIDAKTSSYMLSVFGECN